MQAKVVWKGRLSFEGTSDSGFTLPLGSASEHGGDNDGFRPIELFAIGLAGCTAMDVISILSKKRQEVSAFEVSVNAKRAEEHPRVFTQITIHYDITGNQISEEAVKRAIDLSAEKYCPAQAMLNKVAPIEMDYTIHQA